MCSITERTRAHNILQKMYNAYNAANGANVLLIAQLADADCASLIHAVYTDRGHSGNRPGMRPQAPSLTLAAQLLLHF